jgi:[ribosomal protein S5]-alanine N-acetyltransferase
MTFEPFEPTETRRLLLRCVAPTDAAATSALMTPGISQCLASWSFPFTTDMAAERIQSMREMAFRGDVVPLAVTTKLGSEFAGWVTVSRDPKDVRRGSLGYWLGVQYHGRGYMKEAATVALGLAFESLNLDVIEAGAQLDNVASFAVMQSCGMTMVGERMLYASARARNEVCRFYEISRSVVAYGDERPDGETP